MSEYEYGWGSTKCCCASKILKHTDAGEGEVWWYKKNTGTKKGKDVRCKYKPMIQNQHDQEEWCIPDSYN